MRCPHLSIHSLQGAVSNPSVLVLGGGGMMRECFAWASRFARHNWIHLTMFDIVYIINYNYIYIYVCVCACVNYIYIYIYLFIRIYLWICIYVIYIYMIPCRSALEACHFLVVGLCLESIWPPWGGRTQRTKWPPAWARMMNDANDFQRFNNGPKSPEPNKLGVSENEGFTLQFVLPSGNLT